MLETKFTICCDETLIPVRVGVDDDCVDVDDIPDDRCNNIMLIKLIYRKAKEPPTTPKRMDVSPMNAENMNNSAEKEPTEND